jgi:phage-related minor tail protein
MADKQKPNGVELAVGYVSLTVDSSKMGEEIEKEMGASGTRGGKKAAENTSNELKKGLQEKSKAVGLAATGALAVGIHEGMAQADLPGTIQAQLGTTPAYAKEIADASGKAFASGWGDSLDAVADTAATVGQALNDLGDSGDIAKLTTKSTAFAQTFGQDANAVASSAAQLVRNGLAPSMDAAFDQMTKGFQGNKKMAEDGLDTINEYSVQFKTLGLDGAESMGLLNQGLTAGARSSDLVADGLKEFNIRAKDGSKTTADGFKAIGLNADDMAQKIAAGGPKAKEALQQTLDKLRDMKDPVDRTAASVALFGTQSEDMQTALLSLDPSKATAGLGDLKGAADNLVNNAGGWDTQLAGLHRTLTQGLGQALQPLIPQLKEFAGAALQFFQWLAANPVVSQILIGIGLAIGAVAAAQWVWNAAALANPVTWIILGIMAAIALLVVGITFLATHWGEIMNGLGDGIKAVGTWWNGLTAGIVSGWNAAVGWVVSVFRTAGNAIGSVIQFFKDVFTIVFGYIDSITGGTLSRMVKEFQATAAAIGKWIGEAGQFVAGIWNGMVSGAGDVARGIGEFFAPLGQFVHDVFVGGQTAVADFFNGIIEWAGKAAKAIGDAFGGFGGFIGDVMGGAHKAADNIRGSGGGIPGLATGGTVTGSGTVLIGEAGPELLRLPQGASVIPLDHPAANLGTAGTGGHTLSLTLNNPVAEPTSETLRKAGQFIGAAIA